MPRNSVRPDAVAIVKLRNAKGWTQKKLSEEAKCSRQQIVRVEAGERTSPPMLHRIAKSLGVSYEQLMLGTAERDRDIRERCLLAVSYLDDLTNCLGDLAKVQPVDRVRCYQLNAQAMAYEGLTERGSGILTDSFRTLRISLLCDTLSQILIKHGGCIVHSRSALSPFVTSVHWPTRNATTPVPLPDYKHAIALDLPALRRSRLLSWMDVCLVGKDDRHLGKLTIDNLFSDPDAKEPLRPSSHLWDAADRIAATMTKFRDGTYTVPGDARGTDAFRYIAVQQQTQAIMLQMLQELSSEFNRAFLFLEQPQWWRLFGDLATTLRWDISRASGVLLGFSSVGRGVGAIMSKVCLGRDDAGARIFLGAEGLKAEQALLHEAMVKGTPVAFTARRRHIMRSKNQWHTVSHLPEQHLLGREMNMDFLDVPIVGQVTGIDGKPQSKTYGVLRLDSFKEKLLPDWTVKQDKCLRSYAQRLAGVIEAAPYIPNAELYTALQERVPAPLGMLVY